MCRERFQIGDAGGAKSDREKLRLPRLGHMDERPPVAALAIEAAPLFIPTWVDFIWLSPAVEWGALRELVKGLRS